VGDINQTHQNKINNDYFKTNQFYP